MGGRSATRQQPRKADRPRPTDTAGPKVAGETPNNPPLALFSEYQRKALRVLLGDRFDEVFPELEAGVRRYKIGPKPQTLEEKGRRHEDVTEVLQRQCGRVLRTLEENDSLAREACGWGVMDRLIPAVPRLDYLNHPSPAPNTPSASRKPGMSLYDLGIPPWARGETARSALEDLLADIQGWQALAHKLARRPRGRQNKERLKLNLWTGTVLKRAGLRLTTSRHGPRALLAEVIRIVDKASGLPVPKDIYRDLKFVCDHQTSNTRRQRRSRQR